MRSSHNILDQYEYASDPLLQKHLHAWDRMYIGAIMSYAHGFSNFGRQMMAHQNRVSRDGARFLRFLGYSDRAARNFRAAMLFHDLGKTHSAYNPALWTLDERPTPEEKELQKRHAAMGADMFECFSKAIPGMLEHPHYQVRYSVTRFHHERMDGTGPEGLIASSLPEYVQVACIVDAYDGDMIPRPHQQEPRTKRSALQRLMGREDPKGKYIGAFSGRLLSQYEQMKSAELGQR